ncbi:lysoplasmalogenase [Streptomyces sp. MspMP-M5]|uniref:lysoplasmalogenase n=1 Tax=unclassified Streptomyces TaxID=2593676 RepID=UPI0003697EE5|nr:lysoplasmalogenase [Streptomyces sp. MspMP-M5]MYT29195.1 lysoplasmalogenase [Streptomyces sp. SID8354]
MRPLAPRPRAARALLVVFAVLAAGHLAALLAHVAAAPGSGPASLAGTAVHLTKPALMPLLAAHVLLRGGPPLLAGALLFGCGGDTFLQIGGATAFRLGMGSFAAGHLCYLLLFARHGGPIGSRPTRTAAVAGLYAAALVATVLLLWPDLPAGLRIPVAGYSLLLTATAFGALRAGPRAAAGGLLFLLSDSLIAGGLAHWPQLPAPQFWIMLTYTAAQYALALGVLAAAAGPDEPVPPAPRPPVAYGAA